MELKWQNINIQLRNNNKKAYGRYFEAIKNSSGSVQAGQMLAVMGPSGGGKTTLMNVLSGLIPPGTITQGQVLYNDAPRDSNWGRVMGFVNQEDHVYDELTCRDMIRYSGFFRQTTRCRKDSEYSKSSFISRFFHGLFGDKKMDDHVQSVIEDLNLEDCADTCIKKLSGGERKRTMIAVELVAQPEVLFLDEPTSGLDAFTARKIVTLLKKLAISRNIIVVSTIHQPSTEVFETFDSVILLSKGLSVYSGPVDKIEEWLSNHGVRVRQGSNVPDFLLEICSAEFQRENPAEFESLKSIFYQSEDIKNPSIQKSSNDLDIDLSISLAHILMLFMRKFRCESSKVYKFTKYALKKTVFMTLSVYVITYLFSHGPLISQALKIILLKEYEPEVYSTHARSFFVHVVSGLLTLFQVTDVASTFIYQVLPVKKELFVKAYSRTSFYWGMFLYSYLIQLIFTVPPIACSRYFFPKIVTLGIICAMPLLILGNTILGLFIASFSISKILNRFYAFFISSLGSLFPNTIAFVVTQICDKKSGWKYTLIKCVTCLFFFLPTSLLNMLVSIVPFYRDFIKNNITNERLFELDLASALKDKEESCYRIFFLKNLTRLQMRSITALSCFTMIVLSIIFINITMGSPIRYKLQKKRG